MAKLWKYYSKQKALNNKSKAFYLAYILDYRIKKESLDNICLSSSIIANIYNKLKIVYNR
jgi:hypothetical protein